MLAEVFWFEGPDMCGKSTQIKNVEKRLTEKGYKVLTLKEPGGQIVGNEIRKLLLDIEVNDIEPLDYMARRSLYFADHMQKLELIRLMRYKYDFILCDRYSPISDLTYGALSEDDEHYKSVKLMAFSHFLEIERLSQLLRADKDIIKHHLFKFKISKEDLATRILLSKRSDVENIYDKKNLEFKERIRENCEELYAHNLYIRNDKTPLRKVFNFFSSTYDICAEHGEEEITDFIYQNITYKTGGK